MKNISKDGFVYNSSKLFGIENVFGTKVGINNACTFHLICKNCDNLFFKDLKRNKITFFSQTILAKIMIKSLLREIEIKKRDGYIYPKIYEMMKLFTFEPIISKLNVRDYEIEYDSCLKVLQNQDNMILYEFIELPYMVSFASQSLIAIQDDLEGNIINDCFNMNSNYNISSTCWCVFPLQNKTFIFIFGTKESQKRYKNFFKQFRKLSYPDKLKLVQTVIFSYSEIIFMSENLEKEIIKDLTFQKIASQGIKYIQLTNKIIKNKSIDLSEFKNIKTCFLDRRYSLISLNTIYTKNNK